MSQEKKWYLMWAERLIFPEQRKWIVGILIATGLPQICGPFWEPALNAVLQRYVNLTIPPSDPRNGWILLVLGLGIFAVYEIWDRRPKPKVVSLEYVADNRSLLKLFSSIHVPTFNYFFQHGAGFKFYFPAIHFFHVLEEYVQAAHYHMHDQELREQIDGLYDALNTAMDQIDYFAPTSNESLLRFDSQHDIHANVDAKKARDLFLRGVREGQDHLRSLCRLVNSKYPDFDIDSSSRAALDEYLGGVRKCEEAVAATVSAFEVSVLGAILSLEDVGQTPNLLTIASVLTCDRLDLKVALDRLIERAFVKHLYRGWSYQKYTVLSSGTAYYVVNREKALLR